MAATVVRYTTAEGRAEENQALIEAVFRQLAETQPKGLQYLSPRVGNDFVHIAVLPDDGTDPLAGLGSFGEFTGGIAERCDGPPDAQSGVICGSYGFGE
ncbi:MAG: hypothetical protein KJN63_09980 [Acidimicrobiia bacterium]|nr:hypothetical protein [Acidimicrobiia bacterium]